LKANPRPKTEIDQKGLKAQNKIKKLGQIRKKKPIYDNDLKI